MILKLMIIEVKEWGASGVYYNNIYVASSERSISGIHIYRYMLCQVEGEMF